MVASQAQRPSDSGSFGGNRYSVSAFYSMAAEHDPENFVLERDVRYLDGRIALLIQNRMALDEVKDMAVHLEENDSIEGIFPDDRKRQPRHVATLTRLVSLTEIDTLLQTVIASLLTMFQSVLSAQFDAATEFGSLLRANTPVSRMMTTYTRRGPGQTYLKSVLSSRINSIIEDTELNLEINPDGMCMTKLSAKPEKSLASRHPQGVKAIVATGFLDTILNSLDAVPYGIRWICKQICSLTKDVSAKYPQASDYSICTLIGAFFFLRFLNPAIVTPQAYMLVEKTLVKHPRRTLTLVLHAALVNRFLNELCEVGDFYESLEMDQYIALSKKDLVLNITLNEEMFNTHALLVQHMDALAPNEDQRLRICLE
ncbi:RasGAP protein, partial [Massospora cicadina]